MRLHNHPRILATAASLAALAGPAALGASAAHASAIDQGSGRERPSFVAAQYTSIPQHHADSTDWETLAIGVSGTVLVIGAGLVGSRRFTRRRASAGTPRASHVA